MLDEKKLVEQMKSILSTSPNIIKSEMEKLLGIDRHDLNALCRKHGIKVRYDNYGKPGKFRIHTPKPRTKEWRNRYGTKHVLTSNFIGGASEMVVCADLLMLGLPVFRAITHTCFTDLVTYLGEKPYRIEVKSSMISENGYLRYQSPANNGKYDVLALVTPNGEILYKPDFLSEYRKSEAPIKEHGKS